MKQWRKLSVLVVLLFAGLLLQGCATLNSSVPFRYVSSLTSAAPDNLRLGMEKLADKRPEGDRSATESIQDVDDKVTSKFLEDFRGSQIFAAVDFPVQSDKDDFIMKGEINRFYWKLTPSPIAFIPIINLIIYFGVPVSYAEGIVQLNIQVADAKTGGVLAEYEKSATKTSEYSIYNLKAGEAGAELAEAFRDVSKQIKEAIVADIKAGRLRKR